jgi:hypothetical protein
MRESMRPSKLALLPHPRRRETHTPMEEPMASAKEPMES